jgi:hypothetical protein
MVLFPTKGWGVRVGIRWPAVQVRRFSAKYCEKPGDIRSFGGLRVTMIMISSQPAVAGADLPEQTYHQLYARTLPVVIRHICRNSGTETDAKDVFQDAILILVRNQRRAGFRLEVEAGTYVHAVASRLLLKRLRPRRVRVEK